MEYSRPNARSTSCSQKLTWGYGKISEGGQQKYDWMPYSTSENMETDQA